MKEFAMKHPIITFFLIGAAIDGIVKIAACGSAMFIAKKVPTDIVEDDEEEETEDEPESSNDIQ